MRHPCQRMEPVEGAGHARREQNPPVEAPDVFELVDEGAAQWRIGPVFRLERDDDCRTQQPTCERSGHAFVQEHIDATRDTRLRGELLTPQ